MLRIGPALLGSLLAGMVALQDARAGEASVRFVAPERFTDASINGDHRVGADAPALQELARFIERLAGRGLPAGQTLEVEVTDVDLAGRYEPWRIDAQSTRIVTSATWPRIRLRYRLVEGDRVIRSGEDDVHDQTFEMRPGRLTSGDRLFSEKAMLDDWFHAKFSGRTP
ncbi:DUF3016 domain-containing protein [Roseomonas elaeocarpi]|uniref:DUF3016 domain-containing protein n=1 Tax=Roseomonas elaeocarpi TaxID=907779 RepID=A0ABV6JMC3_9PROT